MKIFIAVPTYENITPDTFKSIYGLDKGGHWCVFDFVRGYDCAAARNRIAQQTLDEQADYVLMVDNDITLPSDALVNLLEQPVDVCLGYYAHRNAANVYAGKTNACRLGEFNYTQQIPGAEFKTLADQGKTRMQIHGGGLGCALIRADVFRRLPYPWFKWVNYPDGGVLSEDLYFCDICGKNGIPVYVDTRTGCGHLMRHVQWPV